MKIDKNRTLQLICFAILMGFLVFVLAFDADASDCKPTNAQQLLTLAQQIKPVKIVLVKK